MAHIQQCKLGLSSKKFSPKHSVQKKKLSRNSKWLRGWNLRKNVGKMILPKRCKKLRLSGTGNTSRPCSAHLLIRIYSQNKHQGDLTVAFFTLWFTRSDLVNTKSDLVCLLILHLPATHMRWRRFLFFWFIGDGRFGSEQNSGSAGGVFQTATGNFHWVNNSSD